MKTFSIYIGIKAGSVILNEKHQCNEINKEGLHLARSVQRIPHQMSAMSEKQTSK